MLLLPASEECIRSNDSEYPFRQNSDFHYLTGFAEPDALLMLVKDTQGLRTILFNRRKDKQAEIWHGYRLGQEAAIEALLIDEAYLIDDVATQLKSFLSGIDTLYYPMFVSPSLDMHVAEAVNHLRAGVRRGLKPPQSYADCLPMLHEMRLIKSEQEATLMGQAAQISAAGHVRAMQQCHVGMWEYQLEAEIKHEFALRGAPEVAYNSIVAGGANACILHYINNDQQLQDGDLVLIDAGAEFQGYAGDITRTFPVNGTFSECQAKLYQLVLHLNQFAISQVKPGATMVDINQQVIVKLVDGLIALGLLQGEPKLLIEQEAHKAFYMHSLGHYLGLDVHDVGDAGTLDDPRPLEAGMAITIEPGLYVANDADVDDCWKGIGIRIEDDLLVNETGAIVLTAGVPKTIAEIEALMADAKKDAK